MTVHGIIYILISSIVGVVFIFLSIPLYSWLVDKELIPVPGEINNTDIANKTTLLYGSFVIGELIITALFTFLFIRTDILNYFAKSWGMKTGLVTIVGYTLLSIDKTIRKKHFSFPSILFLSFVVDALIGLLLSLCSKNFLFLLLAPALLIAITFLCSFDEIIEDKKDRKYEIHDFSCSSYVCSAFMITGVLISVPGLYLFDSSNPNLNGLWWKAIIALIIGLWWLWVTMDFTANLQDKTNSFRKISKHICLLYGTELILAYVILFVKSMIPSIKDIYENMDPIDTDI